MRSLEHSVLYGLRVSSELPLLQGRPTQAHEKADLTIRIGEDIPQQTQLPLGEQLLHFAPIEEPYYTFARLPDGDFLLRFFETCDFVVSADVSRAEVRPMEGADVDVAAVLAAGALLSFVLAMRGTPVLHASAVQVGDEAIAFVGYSGMGKSTMATLMCADGARLITDDVLRLEIDQHGARCRLGGMELRLRKAADDLSARFASSPGRRKTADDRDALAPRQSQQDLLPLKAVLLPSPRRDIEQVALRRLSPVEALLSLVRYPRLLGWLDEAVQAAHFGHLAALAERVPCFIADVPWGPPFSDDVAAELMRQLEKQLVS